MTLPLISVCICTFLRPALLEKLLVSLAFQVTKDRFNFEIIVVDNDADGSARTTIDEIICRHPTLSVIYEIEPRQGISYARNHSVILARGEYLAFVDDDEIASREWLSELFSNLLRFRADAVFGPTVSDYPMQTPEWVIRSRLWDRPRYATGTRLCPGDGRTGNALILESWAKRRHPAPFDEQFARTGGEDTEFFEWVVFEGGLLYWCDTAEVREVVPQSRQGLRYMLNRKFRTSVIYWRIENRQRGIWKRTLTALMGASGGVVFAVLGLLVLPFGLHQSAKCWAKMMNGFGRIGALTGLEPIGYSGR